MNIVNCGITNFIKNHPDIEINLLEEMLSFLKSLKNLDADDILADYWSVDDSLVVRLWNGNKSVSIMKNLVVEDEFDDEFLIMGWFEKDIKLSGSHNDIVNVVKIVDSFLKEMYFKPLKLTWQIVNPLLFSINIIYLYINKYIKTICYVKYRKIY